MNTFTHDQIKTTVTNLVAREIRMSAAEIPADQPLTRYGLDSLAATVLVGEIEDAMGLQLDATMLWDHQTINALVAYVEEELSAAGKSAQSVAEAA